MNSFKILKDESHLFFLLLVPIFSFLWHYENNQLPISDPVEYLDSAYNIFLFLKEGEYANFLISIFNERGWRPIIFQIFIFPLMLITNGNILFSVLLTHVLFNTLSTIFIYKIFKVFIDRKFDLIIYTLIISLSFNILFGGIDIPLFAEISFISFFLGTIYYLLKSDLFKNKSDSRFFTIFFTLTILTRPVEGLIFLIPALIVLILKRYRHYVSPREIIVGISYPIFFIWLLFVSRIFPDISSSVIKIDPPNSLNIFIISTLIISAILFLVFSFHLLLKLKGNIFPQEPINNYFKKSFFMSSIIIWIWYTPRFGSLYGWVYDTSIGDTFSHLKLDIPSNTELILSAIRSNGEILIYIIITLFLITFIHNIFLQKVKFFPYSRMETEFKNFTLFLISALPIPIILYFSTHQISYRKISPVIVVLLIYFLIYIYQNKKNIKITNLTLTAYLLIHIIFLTKNIYYIENNYRWNNYGENIDRMILGYEFPRPINANENNYKKIISFLKDEKAKQTFNKLSLVFSDSGFPIERYLFKFLCKIHKIKVDFFYPENFNKSNYSELQKQEAFLFILPPEFISIESDNIADEVENYIAKNKKRMSLADYNLYNFIYLLSSNKLSKYNFYLNKCYNFYEDRKSCLVTKKFDN